MKKLLLIIGLAVAVSSCAVTNYQENRHILDFRPYTSEGFKIYSTPLIGEPYDCLALISLEVIPGKVKNTVRGHAVNGEVREMTTYSKSSLTPEELLKKFVRYAKDLGANGILDLNMTSYIENGRKVYKLTGSAIKISNN